MFAFAISPESRDSCPPPHISPLDLHTPKVMGGETDPPSPLSRAILLRHEKRPFLCITVSVNIAHRFTLHTHFLDKDLNLAHKLIDFKPGPQASTITYILTFFKYASFAGTATAGRCVRQRGHAARTVTRDVVQ